VVLQKEEIKYMKQLTIEYMSEESDCPNNSNVIIIHPVPWRSKSKQYFVLGWNRYCPLLKINR
jgi:hypothetical protein